MFHILLLFVGVFRFLFHFRLLVLLSRYSSKNVWFIRHIWFHTYRTPTNTHRTWYHSLTMARVLHILLSPSPSFLYRIFLISNIFILFFFYIQFVFKFYEYSLGYLIFFTAFYWKLNFDFRIIPFRFDCAICVYEKATSEKNRRTEKRIKHKEFQLCETKGHSNFFMDTKRRPFFALFFLLLLFFSYFNFKPFILLIHFHSLHYYYNNFLLPLTCSVIFFYFSFVLCSSFVLSVSFYTWSKYEPWF